MKKSKLLSLISILSCLLIFIAACGKSTEDTSSKTSDNGTTQSSEETTTDNNESTSSGNTSSSEKNTSENPDSDSNDDSDTTTENPDQGSDSSNTDTNSQSSDAIEISSSSEAVKYLKDKLNMNENDDILFDDMGGALEKDEKGSYYTIKLISKSLQKKGGSGTAGIYKVYQDGTYKLKK